MPLDRRVKRQFKKPLPGGGETLPATLLEQGDRPANPTCVAARPACRWSGAKRMLYIIQFNCIILNSMGEIQSLARGLKILDLLGRSREGVSNTELAAALGVDKGSASRLASTLARYGYAEKDTATRRYRLGPQVVSLGRSLLLGMPLREAARPFLRQLTERTGECSHLAVLMQGKALYIDQVESPATLRVNVQVGQTAPLHCTALGKILLAYSDLEPPAPLEAFTPRTLTDPDRLAKHLAQVRQQGYAVDDEEYDPGVRCVAVPVHDLRGVVVGAIGISGPASRMSRERTAELAAAVVEIGRALSERLQFTPS